MMTRKSNQSKLILSSQPTRARRAGSFFSLALVFMLFVGLLGQPVSASAADGTPDAPDQVTATYTYDNTVSGTIPGTDGCTSWPANRYFLVNDHFTITDLNVGFNATHGTRGQLQVKLTSPTGLTRTIMVTSSDTNNDYDILLDGDSGGALNDGSADPTGSPYYDRTVQQTLLNDFDGLDARGAWALSICDNNNTDTGTFNRAQLAFTGDPISPLPPQHTQGPAIVETYFVPWPEDQLWTAMGTIYTPGRAAANGDDDTCSSFETYDGNPRQPFVNYISVTIVDAGTVIAYDHWEDGYEATLTDPSQSTTVVWGDGDLLNGVAPGDADDILVPGQIIILNDAMDTSTLQTIVDYDARDKVGASKPIAMTRSGWADGSQTLFAHSDEVIPTSNWGVEYRLPVGENADLNEMFQYTGISVMAAVDGTVVSIDKDANGTAEMTCNLNQGQSCQWNDSNTTPTNNVIGNGLNRGSKVTSNAGHPIQVSLLTGDVCAGFETRSYTLLPVEQWDRSYYSPVGTHTTAAGPGNDDAPTTVHLYNPGTSAINVAYSFATGAETVVNIAANSGANVVMQNLNGAHFYSVVPGTTNNVRDTFSNQNYSNNNGSVIWASSWTETGDDGDPANGTIYINSSSNHLRFREDSVANDAITRQANLSGYSSATLSFDIDGTNIDTTDDISILISSDGTNFTELERFNGDPGAVTRSYDITSYISSQTTVRFLMRDTLETGSGDGNYWLIDNVDITFKTASTPSSSVFNAVASVDSDNAPTQSGDDRNDTYDWGFTLVPEKLLSQFLIVGWAPGDDPSFQGSATENTSPIWLTGGHPAALPAVMGTDQPDGPQDAFDICIDDGGNGGSLTDPITGRNYDRKITGVAVRSQLKIYNGGSAVAGQDQTGMQIWVCDGSDAFITAAWGEDPLVAARGKPAMDMGNTIRNQRAWTATKSAALQVDLNANGLYDEGDTIRYTITVQNTGASSIPSGRLNVKDSLPTNAAYVLASTTLTDHNNNTTAIADGTATPFPLDESGYTYGQALPPAKNFKVSFDVTINSGASSPPATVTNIATVTDDILTLTPDVTITVQAPKPGVIGNYVWLDEDGDGDQDAGEAGIPNVKVELCADVSCTTILNTTYTDANGGYLFTKTAAGASLMAGTYYVRTTPPAGLNQTYDENGALDNKSQVVLNPGQEYLTADFGYNWSTPTETNTNTGTGAIGDRVWSDVDGDGKQDPEEVGIAGVSVQLITAGADGLFGTADDVVAATTSTDSNGNYLFDNLPAGSYVVKLPSPPSGYTQTGDPDQYGIPCTACDHKTTSPIALAPGDVFVNADFGYQPAAGTTGSIGDTLWVDTDRQNDIDAGEPLLAGVTVALIKDLNGNGAWDADEPIIATDITDSSGQYLFTGLPVTDGTGTDDYLVWVNDTNNVIGDLVPTYDVRDGGSQGNPTTGLVTGLTISAVTNLTTTAVVNADFAFAPSGHDAGEGLIGDTVFMDRNANGSADAGEGLEGVTVRLYAADGTTLLAVTTTNENGQYFFGGLNPTATYVVQVQTSTLPYTGMTNTVDPDGGNNSTSTVNLNTSGPVNLAQDFGYRDTSSPNTITGTIWNDLNADGTLVGGETGRFAGVTVALYNSSGKLVATTTTDGSGNYSFGNLPDGTYKVDVTDDNNILNGFWKSTGPSAGSDNNSQVDPYTVSVSGGATNNTADFGYYAQPAALGNFVWEDLDGDGIQDGGEPGIPMVEVTLTITWPGGGGTTTVKTLTDVNGNYNFGNLLLDEDFNTSGGGGPTFAISYTTPAGYTPTLANQGADESVDSDASGVAATATQGTTNTIYDFGFRRTGVIGDFVWMDADRDGVQDASEDGIAGVTMKLYQDDGDGVFEPGTGDTLVATTVTDAFGNYLFSGVQPGSYFVDLDQTTLPPGLSATTGTTDPHGVIALTSGGSYLAADFGYGSATGSAIGDLVWHDVNGNGVQDPGEPGIGGVTVTVTGPGCPSGCTTTTDADGSWLVTGLTPGLYTVTVTPPGGYNATPTNGPASRAYNVLAGQDVLYADFGFNGGPTASIGDQVFLDLNKNGVWDSGEGIPNVTLNLWKDTNNNGVIEPGTDLLISTDTTDANGNYSFVGLPAGDYLVDVTDINNVLSGLSLTAGTDPHDVALGSGVAYTTADFGYQPTLGAIGNLVWHDLNGDGNVDAGESGMQGVTVDLYLDSNNNGVAEASEKVRTTVTNANGNYVFLGLPAGNYLVDVVQTSPVLAGYTKTTGSAGVDNNSQADPYAVTLPSGTSTNFTADFGWVATNPHNINGIVWEDDNKNGTRDGTPLEALVPGSLVSLYRDLNGNGVLDPGEPLIGTTISDSNGAYSFTNLPDGKYIVTTTTIGTFVDGFFQTTQTSTAAVQPVTLAGADSNNNNFGFAKNPTPTAVTVVDFLANYINDQTVQVEWTAVEENDTSGYLLYRSTSLEGARVLVTATPIPVKIGSEGEAYIYQDQSAPGGTVYYWLARQVAPSNDIILLDDVPPAVAAPLPDLHIYLPFTSR